MAGKTLAGQWMSENGIKWKKHGRWPKTRDPNNPSSKTKRCRRGKILGERVKCPIRVFVEENRHAARVECIFVPAAQRDVPAQMPFCGRSISAARYMLLLTRGAPKSDGMVTRHLCGNGHLSCVNPSHLVWGTTGDNISDANKHRKAGDDAQDRINAID